MDILFAGTPDFAAACLNTLIASEHRVVGVVTQPDKPGKRGRELNPCPVKQVAVNNNLRVVQPERLSVSALRDFKADLMVVAAYGQILTTEVLDWPKFGCINVHTSLLPRWRGAAPVQRAILTGDLQTGVCIMQMDEGLDTGDILAQVNVPVSPLETTESLFRKLQLAGTECLLNTIQQLAEGTVTPLPQSKTGITYAKKISRAEARINWESPLVQLDRFVRAFNPDPIAYTFMDGLRIKVWQAEISDPFTGDEPGTIVDVNASGIKVACLDGHFLLTRIQLPIGKGSILSGQDILNARRDMFKPGKRFNAS